jgi:long-chain acyl-CoA synthetase
MRDWLANREPLTLRWLRRGLGDADGAGGADGADADGLGDDGLGGDASVQSALWTWEDGVWHARDWRTIAGDVCRVAAWLAENGVRAGTLVAHIADNSYTWILTDLALMGLGAIHVPMHTSLPVRQWNRQLRHCHASIAILGERQRGLAGELAVDRVFTHRDILAAARQSSDVAVGESLLRETQRTLDPHIASTILYTSGTLGEPKGVVLSHANLLSNTNSILQAFVERERERRFCLLPFSHIYARTCDLYVWAANGTEMALAARPESLAEDLRAIGPTFINGVPLFFDRLRRQLQAAGVDRRPGSLRAALGGRIELCVCGGAATPEPLYDFFHDQGVPLLPGYGLTEASPVVAASTAQECERGAVGRPLPGVEVRLADDGEILARGPSVMLGYHADADATAEAVRDGWLHTGDLGAWTDRGLLRVVGRKKECFALATGKNVAPATLELQLLEDPRIAQAAIVGDGRDCLVALVVLRVSLDAATNHANSPRTAAQDAPTQDAPAQIAAAQIAANVAMALGERQQALAPSEQVRGLLVLERPFTLETGECTTKLTLCRHVIERNYRRAIEGLYAALKTAPRSGAPLTLSVRDADKFLAAPEESPR